MKGLPIKACFRTVNRLRAGLCIALATICSPLGAQGRNVDFGLATQFDTGYHTSVALNRHNTILEVHKLEDHDTLWYHVGTMEGAAVYWEGSTYYDSGVQPSCALNNDSVAVEVHKSEDHDTLWYHVARGVVPGASVPWSTSHMYDDGVTPSVALNDQGVVVEVHKSENNSGLWYHVGRVNGDQILWGSSHHYDNGLTPCVALNNSGLVVEVHQSQNHDTLWYHVGHLQGETIGWGPSRQYDDGKQPSVALTDDGLAIETHKSQFWNTLWSHAGSVVGDRVDWSGSSSFDDGVAPSVATNGPLAIQTHNSSSGSSLWHSTSRVTDRSNWMGERLNQLGSRTLKELTIPGSHDAGMYLAWSHYGFPSILGKTQDLSLYGQLSHGIRYFDLRPYWVLGTHFDIYHGDEPFGDIVRGPELMTVLNDVRRFMQEGHRELVILKFSKYHSLLHGLTDFPYAEMVRQIQATIGPWLYTSLPKGKRLAEIPLGTFLEKGGRVLVLCDGNYPLLPERKPGTTPGDYERRDPGIYCYRDWDADHPEDGNLTVFDKYADKTVLFEMEEDQIGKFEAFNGSCQKDDTVPCDLFLLSWTLTPITAVWPFAQIADRALGDEILSVHNAKEKRINIVFVDYGEYARATDVCLYLNETQPGPT